MNECFGKLQSLSNPMCSLCKVRSSCKHEMKRQHLWQENTIFNYDLSTKEGEDLFIKLWNSADRDGILTKLAKKFNVSIQVVARLRKKLNLPTLHGGNHPGRIKLIKKIIDSYNKGYSSLMISRAVNLDSQNILNILRKNKIKRREAKVFNVLEYKTSSNIPHQKLLNLIYDDYVIHRLTIKSIAKKYNLDQGTVSHKLDHMNVKKRNYSKRVKVNYNCQWCNKSLGYVNVSKGPKKQLYCGSSCKNKAKDYRRMVLHNKKYSETRVQSMKEHLQDTFQNNFSFVHSNILSGGETKVDLK